jgi:hypothetical protein
MKKIEYGGWKNCILLTNGKIEVVVTTDVGPRIIRLGFVDDENILKEFKDNLGKTGSDSWRPYGGHRLWHAPEHPVRTYWPDNVPVKHSWDGKTLKLTQEVESNGVEKEIEITLDADVDRLKLLHRLTNKNFWKIKLAPWCLTVMAPGGRVIFPQEPYGPHPEYLLPARPLVLWQYTDMSDPRYTWGKKYIQIQQDPKATTKQKIGLLNKLGWAAYYFNKKLFIKKYPYIAGVEYPDYGCNTESYTDPDIIEIESIGPLVEIEPDGKVEYIENWSLHRVELDEKEDSIDKKVIPLINK